MPQEKPKGTVELLISLTPHGSIADAEQFIKHVREFSPDGEKKTFLVETPFFREMTAQKMKKILSDPTLLREQAIRLGRVSPFFSKMFEFLSDRVKAGDSVHWIEKGLSDKIIERTREDPLVPEWATHSLSGKWEQALTAYKKWVSTYQADLSERRKIRNNNLTEVLNAKTQREGRHPVVVWSGAFHGMEYHLDERFWKKAGTQVTYKNIPREFTGPLAIHRKMSTGQQVSDEEIERSLFSHVAEHAFKKSGVDAQAAVKMARHVATKMKMEQIHDIVNRPVPVDEHLGKELTRFVPHRLREPPNTPSKHL